MTAELTSAVGALLDDLEAEEQSIDFIVSGLDAAGWARPTQAPGWDVRDQITHLAFVEDLARQSAADPTAFARTAVEAAQPGFETSMIGRGRAMSGVEVLRWWRQARASALDALRAIASAEPNTRLAWFGPSMGLRSFATARLMETWAHGWEVAEAVGAELQATQRLRHVAHLGVTTRAWSYAVRNRPADQTPVHVELRSPDGDDLWTWGEPDASQAIRGSALEFCLVVTQRRRFDETTLDATSGSAREWLEIAQAFAGPPTQRSRSSQWREAR